MPACAPPEAWYYTELNGSVSRDRPHLRRPRRPDPAGGARAARTRAGLHHRPGRPGRHHPDRDEEAREAARGSGAGDHREGRADAPLRARPPPPGRRAGLGRAVPADAGRAPRSVRGAARTHERRRAMTTDQDAREATVIPQGEREIHVERVFDAPRERVYALFNDPALI